MNEIHIDTRERSAVNAFTLPYYCCERLTLPDPGWLARGGSSRTAKNRKPLVPNPSHVPSPTPSQAPSQCARHYWNHPPSPTSPRLQLPLQTSHQTHTPPIHQQHVLTTLTSYASPASLARSPSNNTTTLTHVRLPVHPPLPTPPPLPMPRLVANPVRQEHRNTAWWATTCCRGGHWYGRQGARAAVPCRGVIKSTRGSCMLSDKHRARCVMAEPAS